jgi:hypothetical protein
MPRDCAEVVCHACRWLGGVRRSLLIMLHLLELIQHANSAMCMQCCELQLRERSARNITEDLGQYVEPNPQARLSNKGTRCHPTPCPARARALSNLAPIRRKNSYFVHSS